MSAESTPTICPSSPKEWRQWLRKNHKSARSVWLIQYKKKAKIATVSWSEAVDQALCFGWIDGKRLSVSDEKFKQFFSKRNPKSAWSRINKEKVKVLIQKRLMTKAGCDAIRVAKENGSWNKLDDVENFTIPPDLERAFGRAPSAKKNFALLPPSTRKILLMKLMLSKRPETRKARITAILAFVKKHVKK